MTTPTRDEVIEAELNGTPSDRLLASLSSRQRMRLARENFAAAERAELDKEIGRTGTVFFSGFLQKDSEYVPQLRGTQAIAIYDKMWRGDGQVRAITSMCELPLLMATYAINPASADAVDVEIAQFVQDNLLGGGMARPWREVLQHILSFLRYGFSAFEPVWTLDAKSQRVMLKKLAPRLARTIYRIVPNADDEIDFVEQRVFVPTSPSSGGPGAYGGGKWEFLKIPGRDLLWFTLNREGNDFFGESILRPAYKHWFIKETLYKVDAIGCERQSMGVPVAIEPDKRNVTAAERANTGKALSALHAHEKAYLTLPKGYEFRIEGITGSTKPILPSIQYHDDIMARSILAQFLNFNAGGSYAMSANLSALFLMALEAYAGLICDTLNKYLVRKLVDYNFVTERYPTITYTAIDQRSTADLITAASELFKAGALTKSVQTENAMRAWLGLPDLTDEEVAAIQARAEALAKASASTVVMPGGAPAPETAPAPSESAPTVDTDSGGNEADDGVDNPADDTEKGKLSDAGVDPFVTGPYWRDMTKLEKSACLTEVDNGIDQGKLDLAAATHPIFERQIAKMLEVAQKQLARNKLNVSVIDVPFARELAQAIGDVQRRMFDLGVETIDKEAKRQRENFTAIWNEPAEKVLAFLTNRATSLTAVLNTKLKANFALALNPLDGEGADAALDAETVTANVLRLADRDLRQASPTLVIDAVNLGRATEAHALGAKSCQYSALLDSNTCSPCGALDGEEIEVGSRRYNEVMPPYSGCDGGDNCRCVLIYDFLE